MPFDESGYPIEDSIKLPLYTVEPEQLSDLVATPVEYNFSEYLRNINQDYSGEQNITNTNFPFSFYPKLFQRYNPYGLPFADGYSTKIYNFYKKYSHLEFVKKSSLLRIDGYNKTFQSQTNYTIDKPLTIVLPNNNKRLDLSYYYPEYNPNNVNLVVNSNTFREFTPEELEEAKTWNLGSVYNRQILYEFSRIDNDCITTYRTRSWLLRFETYFCQGQTIEIDPDILISSLVITYSDPFNTEEIESINSQIPPHYFYDYLDTFLAEIDQLIITSEPNIFNVTMPTSMTVTTSFDYEIGHYFNYNLRIEPVAPYTNNGNYIDQETTYRFEADANNYYRLKAYEWDVDLEIFYNDYQPAPDFINIGYILYANNNFWNNYDFDLVDVSEGLKIRRDNNFGSGLTTEIKIEYYGNSNEFTFNQDGSNNRVWANNFELFNLINNSINTFYFYDTRTIADSTFPLHSKFNLNPGNQYDSFHLEMTQKGYDENDLNRYFTRLAYDAVSDLPLIRYWVGNETQITAERLNITVNGITNLYERRDHLKNFYAAINVYPVEINYATDLNSFAESQLTFAEEIINRSLLGTVDYGFYKWGENIPESQYWNAGLNQYVPHKYIEGYSALGEEGTWTFIDPQGIAYDSARYNGQNFITSLPGNHNLRVNRFDLDNPTEFTTTGTQNKTFTATLTPAVSLKPFRNYSDVATIFDFIVNAHANCYMANLDLEQIKKDVKEIHLTLQASKYAYLNNSTDEARVANLGYYIERIARILGISVNDDGSIRSIRQSKLIDKGDSLPAGWNIGQWGRNQGGSSVGQTGGNPEEDRDGLVYEVRSNKFTNDDFIEGSNRIEQGGYVLCENLPQYLHILMNDLDKALGLQDAGANVVPAPDGSYIPYQGMNTMLLDLLYTLSQMSRNTSGIHVLALKNQAIVTEILAAFGLPTTVKELEINSDGQAAILPYPGLEKTAPSMTDLQFWILQNLGLLVGNKLNVEPTPEEQTQP